MTDFSHMIDLASDRLGGAVLYATDDFFAPKENLLKASKPIFVEGKYTDVGKWMDGWESRRKRTPGHDWCVIRLGLPGLLKGFLIDTSHFKGNYPSHCSITAAAVDGRPETAELIEASESWTEILPKSILQGDHVNEFPVQETIRVTHLRFNIYPDGGVARLKAFGEVSPDWQRILRRNSDIDLAAAENGAVILESSDMFFSSPQNLLMPAPGRDMGDGWETRRRRGPGHDHVLIGLGATGTIRRIEVDTSHFKGNYPESCSLESGANEILSRLKLQAHSRHIFEDDVKDVGPVSQVKFNIYPDGGVSRLRLYGTIQTIAVPESELLTCCGSSRWATAMIDAGPFATKQHLVHQGDEIWWSLSREDWLDAFAQHPQIGETWRGRSLRGVFSQQEQAGIATADREILSKLAEANSAYADKFGYIFIVCATGKTADEMLTMLRERLNNSPEIELRIAAEEQRKITRLRLERIL